MDKILNDLILNNIDDSVLILSKDLKIEWANKKTMELHKLKKSDILGSFCYNITHNSTAPCQSNYHICPIGEVLKTKKSIYVEHTHFDNENKNLYIEVSVHPIKDNKDEIIGFVHISRDITERKKKEKDLLLFRNLLDSSNDAIFLIRSKDAKFIDINQQAALSLEYTRDELLTMGVYDVSDTVPDIFTWHTLIDKILKIGGQIKQEGLHRRKDGSTFPVEVGIKIITYINSDYMVAIARDITNRKQYELKLQNSVEEQQAINEKLKATNEELTKTYSRLLLNEKRYSEIIMNMNDGVAVYQPSPDGEDFIIRNINKAGLKISLKTRDEAIGKKVTDVFPGIKKMGLFEVFLRVNKTSKPEYYPVTEYSEAGISYWVENFVYKLPSCELITIYKDLTEKKKQEHEIIKKTEKLIFTTEELQATNKELQATNEELTKTYGELQNSENALQKALDNLEHLVMHDSLTELPNRRYFENSLLEVASLSNRQGQKFALLIIDIDNFKWINDTFGHDIGDAVLRKLSLLLNKNIRKEDIAARIGGYEFAIILKGIGNYEGVVFSAHKLLNLFQAPFNFKSISVKISISVGIAFYPLSSDCVQTLYRHADQALYKAKDKGKNCVEVYSEEVKDSYTRMSDIEYELQFAIEKKELSLFYQPIIDMTTNKILGVEALLRWHNDKLGNVEPLEFINIAEKKGFINKIGLWAFNEACEQASAWKQSGIDKLFLAVNISPIQLEQANFTSQISKIIEKYNIDPYQLEIELTESAIKNEINYVSETFQVFCKQIHVRLSIDDFGTGFSSLSRLSELPVNTLKIDGSFLKNMHKGSKNYNIVKSTIALAKSLSLQTIAECVETKEQVDILLKLGCRLAQGFYHYKPMSAKDITPILRINC